MLLHLNDIILISPAFAKMKTGLTTDPVLCYLGPEQPYVLGTNASTMGGGDVLSQIQDGEERIIAYFRKTLSPPEKNYCIIRK